MLNLFGEEKLRNSLNRIRNPDVLTDWIDVDLKNALSTTEPPPRAFVLDEMSKDFWESHQGQKSDFKAWQKKWQQLFYYGDTLRTTQRKIVQQSFPELQGDTLDEMCGEEWRLGVENVRKYAFALFFCNMLDQVVVYHLQEHVRLLENDARSEERMNESLDEEWPDLDNISAPGPKRPEFMDLQETLHTLSILINDPVCTRGANVYAMLTPHLPRVLLLEIASYLDDRYLLSFDSFFPFVCQLSQYVRRLLSRQT